MNPASPCACPRCGASLEPGISEPMGDHPPALLADLCLTCLEAIWDSVMAELQSRRRSAAT